MQKPTIRRRSTSSASLQDLAASTACFDGLLPSQIWYLSQRLHVFEVSALEKAGKKMPYISGIRVIDKLNGVFGPGAWSVEDVKTTELYREKGADGKFRAAVQVELYLKIVAPGGPSFRRYGIGIDEKVSKNQIDVFQNASASAYTRALRNAAITLGPQFGLHVMRGKPGNGDWTTFCSKPNPSNPHEQPVPVPIMFPNLLGDMAELRKQDANKFATVGFGELIDVDEEYDEGLEDEGGEEQAAPAQSRRQRLQPAQIEQQAAAQQPQQQPAQPEQAPQSPATVTPPAGKPAASAFITEGEAAALRDMASGLPTDVVIAILSSVGATRLTEIPAGAMSVVRAEIGKAQASMTAQRNAQQQSAQQPAAQPAQQPATQTAQQSAPASQPASQPAEQGGKDYSKFGHADLARLRDEAVAWTKQAGDMGHKSKIKEVAVAAMQRSCTEKQSFLNLQQPVDSPTFAKPGFVVELHAALRRLLDSNGEAW